MQYGKVKVSEYIDDEYPKMLKIEEECQKFSNRLWNNCTTSLKEYKNTNEFNFLVSTEVQRDKIKASLVSSNMLRNIKNVDLKYGYILELKDEGILSAKSNKTNDIGDESTLVTPGMIVSKNIKEKKLTNEIIIDTKKVYATGIYCFTDEDYMNNSNYLKAVELSEEDNLPVIMIDKNEYYFENQRKLGKTA
jgi:hypothetical protein